MSRELRKLITEAPPESPVLKHYRSVKIKSNQNQPNKLKACEKHLPARLPNFDYAFVNAGQGPVYRSVRKFSEPQKTQSTNIYQWPPLVDFASGDPNFNQSGSCFCSGMTVIF
jgi:hypothetical protein